MDWLMIGVGVLVGAVIERARSRWVARRKPESYLRFAGCHVVLHKDSEPVEEISVGPGGKLDVQIGPDQTLSHMTPPPTGWGRAAS